ncbi:SBP (S-ribonuclease binding protein) family protein [Abeliophyllum distichum]|uniref:SBP (S-ribonuclease binding protein) family protein n=1 Tax=Abeliophyllum distichum TaxID=126358 RepID=A0ABD1Q7K3_9LAMI
MAVQAHYPSNFLIRSNALGNDYSSQPSQSGGEFLDNTPIFFDGTNNPRKRGREFDTIPTNPLPFASESQTQLHPNPNFVSTGLHLSFGTQKQLQTSQSVNSFSIMAQHLSHDIKQQRNELQHLLHAQGEQLRHTLAEKRKRHYSALLQAAEDSAAGKAERERCGTGEDGTAKLRPGSASGAVKC